MKMFLFGAGASFGSDPAAGPPLGEGLFDALSKFSPGTWGRISGELAVEFRRDFEQGMLLVPDSEVSVLQREMASYFFQFQPLTRSLYTEVAYRVARAGWKGAFCTLNYERLLEISLRAAGIQPVVGDSTGQVELCFPHGCCHLFCGDFTADARAVAFSPYNVTTNGRVVCVTDPIQHRQRIQGDAFPPVMSYFEPNKRTTSGQSFIQSQRRRWSKLAADSSTIVIVGVRVRPHDSHIWGDLERTSARIVYCGGRAGGVEFSEWAAAHRQGRIDRVLPGNFREEFDRICGEAGI